ncbi:MAG: ComEC/Rec2 family competence protein, partial [Clostridia bacterium]|nr:ComEC/Rec2 family competence protein [Clostridia bacterium]
KYYCTVNGGLQSTYRFSLFCEIASAIERTLYNNLSPETAAVSFAMLTGNTEGISDGTLASFRQGGVAHVFAVSGLHIGVIYGSLTLLFNKMRLNRFTSTVVKIALVAAYAGVCGFSPSSVRALVCCSVSSVSACVYRKYDGLNALAIAAVILLLINPLYMFGTGFVLSFGAMSGIILISANMKRLMGFLPKKLGGALAVGWSAQIATVPCLMSTFGYVSAAGLLLNVIFIPIVSVVYVIIFVGTLVGAVFPAFAATVLPLMCAPLELIINLVTFCGFENSVISGNYGYIVYLPFILLTAGLTDKLNFRLSLRGALVAFPLLVIVLTFAAKTGFAGGGTSVTFSGGYSGGAVAISNDAGSVLIVTDNYRANVDYEGENYDALIVLGGEDNLSVLMSLGCEFDAVYFRGNAIQIPTIGHMTVTYADNFIACGVNFEFNGDVLLFAVDGVTVAVERERSGEAYGSLLQVAQFNLYCYGNDCAVLFTPYASYGLSVCGEMRFIIDGGKILPSFTVPKE